MKILLQLLFGLMTLSLSAQHSLTGTVSSTDSELLGAEVSLYKMNSDFFIGTTTEDDGSFKIEGLENGDYRMVINYLGFKKYRERFTIDRDMQLLPITLQEDAIEIDGVEITGTMIQAIQKGDTTVFNAGAFKTLPDADAKELIAKIPGIEIEGGVVKANGENVTKVTVDGREFFGNDPNVALNALPAEIIEKIEIIDEKSEKSQFTGFDDGTTTKTINIVTKSDKRNGEFGKIYAGYGENDRYQAGGNINIFNGDTRVSIIGLSNNINQQNFSTDDLLGVVGSSGNNRRGRGGRGRGGINDFLVGQQSGIAETNSIGLNFSDKWGEKVDFAGSYFYNNTDNTLVQNIEQDYFSEDLEGDIYTEDNETYSDNQNHRVQGRLNVKFDDNNTLRIQPRISWQDNEGMEFSDSEFLRLGQGTDVATNDYLSNQSGFNLNNSIRFRHAFEKKGRTLSFSVGNSYQPKNGSSTLETTLTRDTIAGENEIQYLVDDSYDIGYEAEVSYTEPLSDQSQLMIDYEIEKDNGEDDRITTVGTTIENGLIDPALSNDQNTSELTNTLSSAYRWRKGKTMLMARARLQHTNIESDQVLPNSFASDKSYLRFLPFLMARLELSEGSNLRLFYRPKTDNPSATQLSETIDNTNPLQLSKGNIDIDQSYVHSLFARYSTTNKTKGTVFYAFAGADYSDNYISERTYLSGVGVPLYEELDIDTRSQLTLPENLSGYLNLRSYLTIGLPVTSIKYKLNFNINGSYNNTPSVIDNNNNDIQNATLGFGVSLTSNISNNVDFTISSKTNLGDASNSLQPDQDVQYLNQTTGLKLDVIFPYGITWRNQINHQLYSGYGEGFDDSFVLGIMSVGKKFLKNDRAEISLSVFDLFNQNQAISRTVNSVYVESTISNVLQRYVMVNFKYDLRHFGKAPASDSRRGEGREGGRRGGGPGF